MVKYYQLGDNFETTFGAEYRKVDSRMSSRVVEGVRRSFGHAPAL